MPSDDRGPNWIISGFLPSSTNDTVPNELLVAARRVWPRVHAQAKRDLGQRKNDPENATLAAEVWEGMLQSVARSLHRLRVSCKEIANIDSYLVGAFRHRFNRTRSCQQRRERTIRLVATANELDALAKSPSLYRSFDFENHVLAKEVFSHMDPWLKKVWTARQYGYSWKEIAEFLGTGEERAKVKFRYKLSLLRIQLRGNDESLYGDHPWES
jgi:DNA-directed RNA polymerase specialized sigma24 family protein